MKAQFDYFHDDDLDTGDIVAFNRLAWMVEDIDGSDVILHGPLTAKEVLDQYQGDVPAFMDRGDYGFVIGPYGYLENDLPVSVAFLDQHTGWTSREWFDSIALAMDKFKNNSKDAIGVQYFGFARNTPRNRWPNHDSIPLYGYRMYRENM